MLRGRIGRADAIRLITGLFMCLLGNCASCQSASPYFRITPEGKVGIGMQDVPIGGVGAARLAIAGADNSPLGGPHMQFTTTDFYPLLQVLPLSHDNVSLNFDSYFDGQWKGSTSGPGYRIAKFQGKLSFMYAVSTTPGSAVAWNDALSINGQGCVQAGGTNVGGNCASDVRLKRDITSMSGSLAAVARLRFVGFEYRDDAQATWGLPSGQQYGVIAQEVREAMPDLVTEGENGGLQVDYSKLDARMRAAVVELARANQRQSSEIQELRDELAEVKSILQANRRSMLPIGASASVR